MKSSVVIFDFEDSFTYNIASEIYALGMEPIVVNWSEAQKHVNEFISDEKKVFVYGPGPGRPCEYESFYEIFDRFLAHKNIYHVGICLGHQLLWSYKGHNVVEKDPVHGQKINITLPEWSEFDSRHHSRPFDVQRYNSLFVAKAFPMRKDEEFFYHGENIMMGKFSNGITYQFHPESVGTSFQRPFFTPIAHFLYNGSHEKDQTERHIRHSNTKEPGRVEAF